jgi:hypothetical protein
MKHILTQIGSPAKTVSEVRVCPAYLKRVQTAIDRANDKAISKAQRIIKFHILND